MGIASNFCNDPGVVAYYWMNAKQRMNPEPISTIETVPDTPVDDRSLIGRIAQGDERAFAQLVSRYSVPVYRFLSRMLGSSEDAEDLTQETFYAVYKYHRNLRDDVDIHPYLFTIARRKAISHIRWRHVRRIVKPLSLEHENTVAGLSASPLDTIEQRQKERLVQDCLNRLHPDKRAAVILRYFEGCSYLEIARILNKPEGTVKSLVFRGEEELRTRIERRLKVLDSK